MTADLITAVILDPTVGLPFESDVRYAEFALFAKVTNAEDAKALLAHLDAIPHAERARARRLMARRRQLIAYEPIGAPGPAAPPTPYWRHVAGVDWPGINGSAYAAIPALSAIPGPRKSPSGVSSAAGACSAVDMIAMRLAEPWLRERDWEMFIERQAAIEAETFFRETEEGTARVVTAPWRSQQAQQTRGTDERVSSHYSNRSHYIKT